jgi:pyruvate/2-oxoglutarate dehydrogenase complex dihydrolipoamide dehydrogenase (E3) component
MEAARVASLRGHETVLFERNSDLGGQLLLATRPPHKDELKNELEYLSNHLEQLNVEVTTGKPFTLDMMSEYSPDAVVVATGAKPCVPPIPGVHGKHVVTAWEVLAEKARVGKRVVVIGGGIVGCETAEFLRERCDEVAIVEMLPELAPDAEPFTRYYLLDRLRKQGIQILTQSTVIEVNADGVVVLNKEGIGQLLETESVVLAMGSVSERELVLSLRDKVAELFTAGDCVAPRLLMDAIHEGFNAALRI